MQYLSICSGIGGFEKAIQKMKPDWKCIGYSEIDKYAKGIYQIHYPKHKDLGNVRNIKTNDLGKFDFLVAGLPCQSFSIAGKRKGLNDTRGTLFFEFARILKDKRPRYFLFENVKGLLSNKSGETFQTILGVLTKIGYDVEWQVCNSRYFKIPQNRERAFIVGYLRGTNRPKVFPIPTKARRNSRKSQAKVGEDLSYCIDANYYKGISPKGYQSNRRQLIYNNGSQGYRIYNTQGTSVSINSSGGGWGANTGLYKTQEGIRRLTPIECERLFGYPDNYTEYGIIKNKKKKISDTQRYKCLGNSVVVNVIEEIIGRFDE